MAVKHKSVGNLKSIFGGSHGSAEKQMFSLGAKAEHAYNNEYSKAGQQRPDAEPLPCFFREDGDLMNDLIRHAQQINQQLARYGVKFGTNKTASSMSACFLLTPFPGSSPPGSETAWKRA